jgi:hypothetical protein
MPILKKWLQYLPVRKLPLLLPMRPSRVRAARESETNLAWVDTRSLHTQSIPLLRERQKFDDFGGRWGNRAHLDRFLQMYAVETTRLEARRRGHQVTEAMLPDGSIQLTIQVAGLAA